MKRILLFAFSAMLLVAGNAQLSPVNMASDRGRNIPIIKPEKNFIGAGRADGTFFMSYLDFDQQVLGSTINDAFYGDLAYTRNDTAFGTAMRVTEYFDSLLISEDLVTWDAMRWSEVATLTVDSIFIRMNVDSTTTANYKVKVKIVGAPTITARPAGSVYAFNNVLWQDSIVDNNRIGTITPTGATFPFVGFGVNQGVTGKFGIQFEFTGPPTDTCRLLWSYPTDGAACANGSVAGTNTTPKAWELYPTSFYSVSVGPTVPNGTIPNESFNLPAINGDGVFVYFTDCDGATPATRTPYINDLPASGYDPNKNQFQHWHIIAKVTIVDNVGIAEQNEKGIKVFAYPVPALETTNIDFTLNEEAENITLTLSDLSGRVISSQVLGAFAAGKNKVTVDTNFPSGVYTYTLNVDGTYITRKIVIGGK